MTWVELGTVNLTYEWQLLNSPAVGTETFRVSHLYNEGDYIHGKVLITQVYSNPYEFYSVRTVYPSRDLKILTLPIPDDFKRQGVIVRYLALKLSRRYYRYSIGWRVKVEEFQ